MLTRTQAVRLLIVDDSALTRQILSESLSKDRRIEVVGAAGDWRGAREKISKRQPDVLLLDLQMPGMNANVFIRSVMSDTPLPIIVFSAHSNPEIASRAKEAGAVAVVEKPSEYLNGVPLDETMQRLTQEVLKAAETSSASAPHAPQASENKTPGIEKRQPAPAPNIIKNSRSLPGIGSERWTGDKVIAIGASTGGTEAITSILTALPARMPPILVVIHMPAGFTRSFAERLNSLCRVNVHEAQEGEALMAGTVLIAPGDCHLTVRKLESAWIVRILKTEPVKRHRPSVDVLFYSVAQQAGRSCLGVLLTGMGSDGAEGLLGMRNAGGHTIAQDERSSIVFGMPKEAIRMNAACDILPLENIALGCQRWAGVFAGLCERGAGILPAMSCYLAGRMPAPRERKTHQRIGGLMDFFILSTGGQNGVKNDAEALRLLAASQKMVAEHLAFDVPSLPSVLSGLSGAIIFDDGSRRTLEAVVRVRKHTREIGAPIIVRAIDFGREYQAKLQAAGATRVCDPDTSIERLLAEIQSRAFASDEIDQMRKDLLQPFIAATIEALQIMAGLQVKLEKVYRKCDYRMLGDISGVIYLIANTERLLAISFPQATATQITKKVLAGFVEDPNIDIICDSVAEIINIIAGQVKGCFVDTPYEFDISTPTVINGPNHEIRHRPDLPCYVMLYHSALGNFTVQLCIRTRETEELEA